jgi:hypothetical protein
MPKQRPGKSEQTVGTPWGLIRAVEARWGKLDIDLAASDDGSNAKAGAWYSPANSYLEATGIGELNGIRWCNPPFANIRPWARKWRQDAEKGARIISLVPLSCCGWFADEVEGSANIVGLVERVTFEGHTSPYPKDLMLLLYGIEEDFEFQTWRWTQEDA